MKLYLLSQDFNSGYDTYDSCIVAAKNEEDAKNIHPYESIFPESNMWKNDRVWAGSPENVTVELIGTAIKGTKPGVILASFNAG
jgi:hypothetical protein